MTKKRANACGSGSTRSSTQSSSLCYRETSKKAGAKALLLVFLIASVFSKCVLADNAPYTVEGAYDIFYVDAEEMKNLPYMQHLDVGVYVNNETMNMVIAYNEETGLRKRLKWADMVEFWEILDYGFWWSEWCQVTGCFYSGKGDGGSIGIHFTEMWEYRADKTVSLTVLKDRLQSSFSLQIAFTWSRQTTYQCNVPADSVGCAFAQHRFLWVDAKYQRCKKRKLDVCTDWENVHTDWPIDDLKASNLGCSVGCHSCHC
ncbi:hypothetical protein V1511DRAFT_493611 [Dipodascopsis uninucleata]